MTQQAQRQSRIPEFASREEEAHFWDTHEIPDYLDKLEVVNRETHALRERSDIMVDANLSEGITVRLTPDLLRRLRRTAKRKGIGPSTLARMWIIEQLQETTGDVVHQP